MGHSAMDDRIRAALQELEPLLEPGVPENVRLAAQKERNRLLNVYELAKNNALDDAERPEDAELAEIRSHLEPLGLADEGRRVD